MTTKSAARRLGVMFDLDDLANYFSTRPELVAEAVEKGLIPHDHGLLLRGNGLDCNLDPFTMVDFKDLLSILPYQRSAEDYPDEAILFSNPIKKSVTVDQGRRICIPPSYYNLFPESEGNYKTCFIGENRILKRMIVFPEVNNPFVNFEGYVYGESHMDNQRRLLLSKDLFKPGEKLWVIGGNRPYLEVTHRVEE
ncbi:MAG: hypothetical protein ABII01_05125 [Candidatus Woesearchaeota archaeon]